MTVIISKILNLSIITLVAAEYSLIELAGEYIIGAILDIVFLTKLIRFIE